MESKEKVRDKIKKLIKKANSAGEIGSIEEASTFMRKANRLLIKYNIDRDEIDLDDDIEEKILHEAIVLNDEHKWNKSDGDWMFHIYNMIAKINLCSAIQRSRKEYVRDSLGNVVMNSKGREKIRVVGRISLLGTDMNKDITKYMAASVINQLKFLSKKAWNDYLGSEKEPTWKRGYFRGAVNTLYEILQRHDELQKKEFSSMTALVKTNNIALREKENETFGGTRSAKSKRVSGTSGFIQGLKDGHKVKIQKGLSANSSNQRKRLN